MTLVETIKRGRPGPFVIVGRPHSGTRAVTQALLQAGVFGGAEIAADFLDSEIWFTRFVVPILSDPRMPALLEDPEVGQALIAERLQDALRWFFRGHDPTDGRPWGWKLAETLFLMREILAVFPGAKFVHVIRDGRDVALSDNGFFQLTMPPPSVRDPRRLARKALTLATNPHQRFLRRYDFRRFCEHVTFGAADIKRWHGVNLRDHASITQHRYLLQMQSWVHCVSTARRIGEEIGSAYLELRYEDFCHRPRREVRKLFSFLDLSPSTELLDAVANAVSTTRIGKWQHVAFETPAEAEDFASAVSHGRDLLEELGYLSSASYMSEAAPPPDHQR